MRQPLLTLILISIATAGCNKGEWTDTSMCLDVPDDATECPAAADVDPEALVSFGWCDADVREITGEGTLSSNPLFPDTGDQSDLYCCYPSEARDADPGCVVGRPFVVGGETTTADLRPGADWTRPVDADPGAIDWASMARMEHASVAAFARLTLDLMALGAPATLVAAVQRAAADEVEHARLCFGMLAARGEALQPGPLHVGARAPVDAATLAFETVREGCLGETMGAWLAARAAEQCEDAGTRAVLARIADDEARHAALSWEIVAWLLSTGAAGVREAVDAAFAEPFAVVAPAGLATEAELGTWVERASVEVIAPARHTLLAA